MVVFHVSNVFNQTTGKMVVFDRHEMLSVTLIMFLNGLKMNMVLKLNYNTKID